MKLTIMVAESVVAVKDVVAEGHAPWLHELVQGRDVGASGVG